MLENKIQNPCKCLFRFSLGRNVMDQRSGDGSTRRYIHFPKFEMLDVRIASALNKFIQNSYFKKKVSLEEQKAQEEDRFFRGRQIAFRIFNRVLLYCATLEGSHAELKRHVDTVRRSKILPCTKKDTVSVSWIWSFYQGQACHAFSDATSSKETVCCIPQ